MVVGLLQLYNTTRSSCQEHKMVLFIKLSLNSNNKNCLYMMLLSLVDEHITMQLFSLLTILFFLMITIYFLTYKNIYKCFCRIIIIIIDCDIQKGRIQLPILYSMYSTISGENPPDPLLLECLNPHAPSKNKFLDTPLGQIY